MIIEKIDCKVPPHEICRNAITRGARDVVFLDSSLENPEMSRFSLIFADPFRKVKTGFGRLKRELKGFSTGETPFSGIPAGAAAGYVTYDAGMEIEKINKSRKNGHGWPEMEFGLYDAFILYDNLEEEYFIISTGLPKKTTASRKERARRRLAEFSKYFQINSDSRSIPPRGGIRESSPAKQGRHHLLAKGKMSPFSSTINANFTRAGYTKAINMIKRYIERGDVYQVNLSQKFAAPAARGAGGGALDAFELYLKIRGKNRVPYGAFINFGGLSGRSSGKSVLSFSMERFLKINGRDVETRPIKGTMPRGLTPAEDAQNRENLLKSAKNQAELLMITDLERNDLGRSCEYGSVTVKKLYDLEEYATVFHLVSTVRGRLRKGLSHVDCFMNSFPGGSVTGAPKIRSMEIIDELECVSRGLYCGSIGYFGFNGVSDFNIAIRTIMSDAGGLTFSAGGGITYDSDPEQEYEETLQKVKTFFDVLGNGKEK